MEKQQRRPHRGCKHASVLVKISKEKTCGHAFTNNSMVKQQRRPHRGCKHASVLVKISKEKTCGHACAWAHQIMDLHAIFMFTHHWYFWATASVVYSVAVAPARSARARTIFWVNMVVVCMDPRRRKKCAWPWGKAREICDQESSTQRAVNIMLEHNVMMRVNSSKEITGVWGQWRGGVMTRSDGAVMRNLLLIQTQVHTSWDTTQAWDFKYGASKMIIIGNHSHHFKWFGLMKVPAQEGKGKGLGTTTHLRTRENCVHWFQVVEDHLNKDYVDWCKYRKVLAKIFTNLMNQVFMILEKLSLFSYCTVYCRFVATTVVFYSS